MIHLENRLEAILDVMDRFSLDEEIQQTCVNYKAGLISMLSWELIDCLEDLGGNYE